MKELTQAALTRLLSKARLSVRERDAVSNYAWLGWFWLHELRGRRRRFEQRMAIERLKHKFEARKAKSKR